MENTDEQLKYKFQDFFITNFPKVKNFAKMLLKSEAEAEDVAQEIFCKLWLQPEIWANNENCDGYIFIMTRNYIMNIFKHQQVEREYQNNYSESEMLKDLNDGNEILNNIYYKEILMIVQLTLEKMPERRRHIFKLSRFEGMSHKEIAEQLNISVRTIEHQIYLALIELKKTLLFLLFIFSLK